MKKPFRYHYWVGPTYLGRGSVANCLCGEQILNAYLLSSPLGVEKIPTMERGKGTCKECLKEIEGISARPTKDHTYIYAVCDERELRARVGEPVES